MAPILHLSLPVRDLDEAHAFYIGVLGCRAGRMRPDWVDVWFYGMQITLHQRPDLVGAPVAGDVRHFGVALDGEQLDALIRRLDAHGVAWLSEPSTDHAGTPREQHKAKLADPSGNVIEVKAYAQPSVALEVPQL